MPSADFCAALVAPHGTISPAVGTRRRPPAISSTAVRTQPPNLRSAPLMEMRFAVSCPLARRSRLVSGSCSSARAFAPRFLQTPPHDDALAVRYPSPPSGWERTCTSKLSSMRGVQEKARRARAPGPSFFPSCPSRLSCPSGLLVQRSVNWSSIVTSTGTGSPRRVPGANLHCLAALIAS